MSLVASGTGESGDQLKGMVGELEDKLTGLPSSARHRGDKGIPESGQRRHGETTQGQREEQQACENQSHAGDCRAEGQEDTLAGDDRQEV